MRPYRRCRQLHWECDSAQREEARRTIHDFVLSLPNRRALLKCCYGYALHFSVCPLMHNLQNRILIVVHLVLVYKGLVCKD